MKPKLIKIASSAKKAITIKEVDQEYLDYPLHFHHIIELVLITQSYGKRIVGNHIGDFSEGDLVIMGPDLPHIWINDPIFHTQQKKLRATAIVIYFPIDFLMQLTVDELTQAVVQQFVDRTARGLIFFGETSVTVANKMKEMINKQGIPKIVDLLHIIDLLSSTSEFEYLTTENYKPTINEYNFKRINDVYLYVMKNYHREISLNEIAGIANLTPNAFCRFFKKHSQKTFRRFVNELRIGYACKLLVDHKLSISQICYKSGYQNLTNFNKFFKLIMKKNPGQYRKDVNLHVEKNNLSLFNSNN